MKITKFGHACVLIEEGEARVLLDPGAFSAGFDRLTDIDAVLITHQHMDHFTAENVRAILQKNPGAQVYADEGSAKLLDEAQVSATTVHNGDHFEVAGVAVEGIGELHAQVRPTLPRVPNVGYLIAESFFYPGDNFTEPGRSVKLLAVPAAAPWLKVSEAIEYMLAVKPDMAMPLHDGVLSEAGKQVHYGMLASAAEAVGIRWEAPELGETLEVQ